MGRGGRHHSRRIVDVTDTSQLSHEPSVAGAVFCSSRGSPCAPSQPLPVSRLRSGPSEYAPLGEWNDAIRSAVHFRTPHWPPPSPMWSASPQTTPSPIPALSMHMGAEASVGPSLPAKGGLWGEAPRGPGSSLGHGRRCCPLCSDDSCWFPASVSQSKQLRASRFPSLSHSIPVPFVGALTGGLRGRVATPLRLRGCWVLPANWTFQPQLARGGDGTDPFPASERRLGTL